jgi:hypothetical protein
VFDKEGCPSVVKECYKKQQNQRGNSRKSCSPTKAVSTTVASPALKTPTTRAKHKSSSTNTIDHSCNTISSGAVHQQQQKHKQYREHKLKTTVAATAIGAIIAINKPTTSATPAATASIETV